MYVYNSTPFSLINITKTTHNHSQTGRAVTHLPQEMDPVSKYIQIECKPPPAEKSQRPSDKVGVENKSQLLKYTHTHRRKQCNAIKKETLKAFVFKNLINLIKCDGETW